MLKLSLKNIVDTIPAKQKAKYQSKVCHILDHIKLNSLPGCEMLGWKDLPFSYDNHELLKMKEKAKEWHSLGVNNVVVIGIGGSYVGVRAAIDMCCGQSKKNPSIIWIHNMSSTYITETLNDVSKQKFAIVVISKSGTTIEPTIGFKLFREALVKQLGKQANKYIVAITDKSKGVLFDYASKHKYTTFVIPDNVGGRFSVLTPVGMFVMILKQIDPLQLLKGAADAAKYVANSNIERNSAIQYAIHRHYFHTHKKLQIENFIVYDPSLQFVGEMWRQIFGESEGKDGKGLYPDVSLFTTDLHSMGQYLQQGTRNFFETTLYVEKPRADMILSIKDNDDKIAYLNKKSLSFINKKAYEGTIDAHTNIGKVNNIIISITKPDAYHFGYFFMWVSTALMISAYLLGVNPFNQPGVEQYKSNMFKLLGKK